MAMFNCEECGKDISEKSVSCPHCGCPNTTIRCPECNDIVSKDVEACPSCGYPLAFASGAEMKTSPTSRSSVGRWKLETMIVLIIVSMVIPLIGIGFGIYGMNNNEKKEQGILLLCVTLTALIITAGFIFIK